MPRIFDLFPSIHYHFWPLAFHPMLPEVSSSIYQLNEEQLAVRDAARDFAQSELWAGVIERDEHQRFPAEQVKRMGELGFMGMMVSPE